VDDIPCGAERGYRHPLASQFPTIELFQQGLWHWIHRVTDHFIPLNPIILSEAMRDYGDCLTFVPQASLGRVCH
jgi:hypothetical protein